MPVIDRFMSMKYSANRPPVNASGMVNSTMMGDLNDWNWIGEDPTWLEKIDGIWQKSLVQLRGERVDVAFLPLDGRLEQNFWLGLHGFLQVMDCKHIFPMHCWGDFSVIPRLKELPESRAYRTKVKDITQANQVFVI